MANFSNVIRIKLVIPIFHTEFDSLQVFAIKTEYFVTKISVKELSGLDQKLIKLLDIYISFKEPSGLNRKFYI